MKHLFILLLSCIPMFSTAQTLTETQKQEALQSANNFCNLLKRFYEGERTLDTQIYGLCSGRNISAYDEIKTNSEKTLSNYLLAIQAKYPGNLAVQLSAPSFSNSETHYDYNYHVAMEYTNLGNLNTKESLVSITRAKILNSKVIFNITLTIPSLSKRIEKKLIYSTESGKITGFVMQNSPIISMSKGLDCFAQGYYNQAINYFDEAIRNGGERFSHKKECNIFAYYACTCSLDFSNAQKYATSLGDFGYILSTKGQIALKEDRISDAIDCYSQIEKGLMEGRKSLLPIGNTYYQLGLLYGYPGSSYNSHKCADYLKKCASSKDIASTMSAYWIYVYWLVNKNEHEGGISDQDMKYNDAYLYLKQAAIGNYPPALLYYAFAAEKDLKNTDEAVTYYKKSADTGNVIAMVNLGRVLCEDSKYSSRKQEGLSILKKVLTKSTIEKDIDEFLKSCPRYDTWPENRKDIEELYNKYANNTVTSGNNEGTSSNISSSNSNIHINNSTTYTTNNSSNHNSINNNYSNHHNSSYSSRRKYRRPFNCPDENYHQAGFSIGYVQKQWAYETEDGTEKFGYWEDSKAIHGIQAGFRIEPLFKYGFGLDTGLYYEFYYSKSKALDYEGEEYKPSLEEHVLYLPVHLEYRLNFSKNFQLFFYGGVGLDYGLSAKIKTNNDNLDYDENNAYKNSEWKRFNASLEYGGGMRICNIQINFTMANGLINMSKDSDYKVKQNKNLMCILSAMF